MVAGYLLGFETDGKSFVEKWMKQAHAGTVLSISFHDDGTLFVSSSINKEDDVKVWTAEGLKKYNPSSFHLVLP